MAAVSDNTLEGALISEPCAYTQTIADLEDLLNGPNPPNWCFWCNYSMGERIFRDLYRNMDETAFRKAFRRLYLHTQFNNPNYGCDDNKKGICHVKEAFNTYVSKKAADSIETEIDRWYYGTEPFDLSYIHSTAVEVDIDTIDDRIEGAYLSFSRDGLPISDIAIEPGRTSIIYMNLDYSYRPSSILHDLPIEVTLSYEGGFEFVRKRAEIPISILGTRRIHQVGLNYEAALGRYWVHVYLGDQKIAEATFETVPPGDPYSIRGIVTGPDDQPLENIALEAIRGDERFWARVQVDGTFEVIASSGIFQLQVEVPIQRPDGGTQFVIAGWYDGKGGVTYNTAESAEIVIYDDGVDGIDIMIPADSYAKIWGYISGPDRQKPDGRIALVAKQGEESFWIDTEP